MCLSCIDSIFGCIHTHQQCAFRDHHPKYRLCLLVAIAFALVPHDLLCSFRFGRVECNAQGMQLTVLLLAEQALQASTNQYDQFEVRIRKRLWMRAFLRWGRAAADEALAAHDTFVHVVLMGQCPDGHPGPPDSLSSAQVCLLPCIYFCCLLLFL